MQQIKSPSVESLGKNGYYTSKEDKRRKHYQNESYIPKNEFASGAKTTAHKLVNDVITYFPKGFKGSKNFDFYEYLSMGMVPYLVGSATLMSLGKLANKTFKSSNKVVADALGNKAAAGVVLYGLGKMASKKLSHTLIHASTGVNLDMKYINKVAELPENGEDKGVVRTQRAGVFDSVDFFRKDLLEKQGELEDDNIYAYYDKIAKKAGYKEKLNAPNQVMSPKIRALKARATAMDNITSYIVAATGVALGAQKAFELKGMQKVIDFKPIVKKVKNIVKTDYPVKSAGKIFNGENLKNNVAILGKACKKGAEQLWKGSVFGKGLIVASIAAPILSWLIPTIGFKTNPNTMKSKVDTNKEFEVC